MDNFEARSRDREPRILVGTGGSGQLHRRLPLDSTPTDEVFGDYDEWRLGMTSVS